MDVEILKTDFAVTRTLNLAPAALGNAQARLRVDRFGLSTNNISYAQSAAFLQYWEFFPSTGPEGELWGRLPVWGFGDVVESNCAELVVGTRLFGYFPMSNELIITPNVNSASTVIDMSAHRAQLPSAYNSFRVCAVDPLFGEDREAQIMLLYPLYFTSFVVDDFIEDDEELKKAQVIISSASAKTAIGAAQLAHRRGAHVVGVTSKGNADFVRALGVYDEVLLYDQVGEIAQVPSVYVDITGNQDLCYRIHTHLGNSLLHSMVVGGTMMGQQQTPHPPPCRVRRPPSCSRRRATSCEPASGQSTSSIVGWPRRGKPSWTRPTRGCDSRPTKDWAKPNACTNNSSRGSWTPRWVTTFSCSSGRVASASSIATLAKREVLVSAVVATFASS